MTTSTIRKLETGDEMEVRTNVGAAPIVFINGVLQPRELYRVFIDSDGLPNAKKIILSKWQPWFAWRPVTTVGGDRVWCRKIYRKAHQHYDGVQVWHTYEYGTEFDILRNE